MSKKNKHRFGGNPISQPLAVSHEHAAEYRVIKWDLIRLVVFNAVVLGAVLAVYYTNLNSHYLENWFSRYIRF